MQMPAGTRSTPTCRQPSTRRLLSRLVLLGALAAGMASSAQAAFSVFEAAGADAAAITPTRDAFRSAIGGGTVAGPHGNFGDLRREINWDGTPDSASAPFLLPGDFFNTTSPRGVVMSTPGTGLMVSANAGGVTAELFGFPGDLQAFSPQKLFGVVGSRVLDIRFFVPGTSTPATTKAFGAVFVDLEDNNAQDFTSMEFFDSADQLLFTRTGLPAGNQGLTFLGGVAAGLEQIARVRITTPDNFLLANGERANEVTDFVIMDDFIYASPAAVPEPEAWAMLLAGLGAVVGLARRRSSHRPNPAQRQAL